jgi:tetratricopeptide (TPR) repeat protein
VRNKNRPALPIGIPATNDAEEMALLSSLETQTSQDDYLENLWQLNNFYGRVERKDLATEIIQGILQYTSSIDWQAACHLRLGQFAEQARQYDVAYKHYGQGLVLNPERQDVAYFLHNNMGFCLNFKGRYKESEAVCRRAIEINSQRANAFKNLGVALSGQGDRLGAAWAWIEATKADPRDVRSFNFLVQLLTDHPDLDSQFPGVLKELDACENVVASSMQRRVGSPRLDTGEICRLKYIPPKGYLLLQKGKTRKTSAEAIEQVYTVRALTMLDLQPNTWVSICAIKKGRTTQAQKKRIVKKRSFRSRSQYLAWLGSLYQPALLIDGETLERAREN